MFLFFFAGRRTDSVLNNMHVDQLYPLSVQLLSYRFLSLAYGVNCLVMCIIVFNENVTINSWELELKIKPRLNCNSLVCHATSEASLVPLVEGK